MTPSEQDPLELVGHTVADKYEVEALLAEGGFSLVYRARHTAWNQPCVLKFLKGLETVSAERRERLVASLVQEGAILRELSSRAASILQAHDLGTWNHPSGETYPYLVLEWLDGRPFSEILEQAQERGEAPLSLAETLRLFEPVARALAEAHKRGIAHRDIKPENLFLVGDLRSDDALLKVLDFGVAKILIDAGAQPKHTSSSSSQSSFTPWYGAPEQFSNRYGATGPWTDVFALALVLVEVLSFQRGLSGDDVMALAVEAMHPSQRPTPRNKGASVSDAVEAVFSKALSVRPEQRPQNVGEFWAELSRAAGVGGLFDPPTAPSPSFVASPSVAPQVAVITPEISAAFQEDSRGQLAPPSGAPETFQERKKPWIWGVIGGASLVLVACCALLLGMSMQRHKSETGPSNSASAAALVAPAPSASAAPEPRCAEGMVKIPGGEFFMGFEGDEAMDTEKPQHSVKLDAFCIDVTEVTVERYRACSDEGRCQRAGTDVRWPSITPQQKKLYGPLCNVDDPGRDKHPINCVTWEMADNFCKRNDKRLPTSAEWEFAVRGPDGRTYPWGDEPPDANRLNACGKECIDWGKRNGVVNELFAMHDQDDGFPTTAPVGSFPKGRSRYGLDDVIGNVMEWVHDWDGPYTKDPSTNPKGPDTGTDRVIRGGAWNAGHMVWVRPSFRFHFPPDTISHGVGFRCAAPLVKRP